MQQLKQIGYIPSKKEMVKHAKEHTEAIRQLRLALKNRKNKY